MSESVKLSRPIFDRDEENSSRKKRMAQMKKGPGVFVYEGGFYVVEHSPTYKIIGRETPKLDASGLPVIDGAGRVVNETKGAVERDHLGNPMLGGKPVEKRIELDPLVVRGVEFPLGKPVKVDDSAIALKLRCLGHVRELEEGAVAIEVLEEDGEQAPRKRGRPAKAKQEASIE